MFVHTFLGSGIGEDKCLILAAKHQLKGHLIYCHYESSILLHTYSEFSPQQGHEATSHVARFGPIISPNTNVALHHTTLYDLQNNKSFTQSCHFLYLHSTSELYAATVRAQHLGETQFCRKKDCLAFFKLYCLLKLVTLTDHTLVIKTWWQMA